jgi:hypothetical protein
VPVPHAGREQCKDSNVLERGDHLPVRWSVSLNSSWDLSPGCRGMAAPMVNFANYGLDPRAALIVDRSLREVSPGVYQKSDGCSPRPLRTPSPSPRWPQARNGRPAQGDFTPYPLWDGFHWVVVNGCCEFHSHAQAGNRLRCGAVFLPEQPLSPL